MTDDRGVPQATGPSGLTPVPEHQARIATLLPPARAESRPLADCLDLALAEDLVAAIPLPPFDNSAMDGYAVRSVDVAEAGPDDPVTLPVSEDVPAGRIDSPPLQPGTAHRIMTGAQMPAGADAVVPVERTDAGTSEVRLHASVQPGAHLRRAGEDVQVGTAVLHAGVSLGPAQLGIAAAVGAARLPVRRPVRVLVLSTGSELVEPGSPLRAGQIYESNGLMLAAAVREAGGEAQLLRFVPDDVDSFHAALQPHLETTDLILTSGGVSAGAYEVVKDALAGNGVEFTKVAMQPGMPQGCGRYRDGPAVVTLPGNPVSSMVSFEIFVRPALRSAAGHHRNQRPTRQAVLTEPLEKTSAGRRQYRRAVFDPATATVTPHGGPGSHLLSAMAGANSLLEVPEETTSLPAGATVDVILME
ncbi:MAG: molybdopterin molybdotransferase MoeA [Saccharopolyspora sp.]|uniref:molybdopterin molybdotransferase MoeA n=1 Tax=Saccharopolyspora TaxID=1835 RepID=UPI00190C6EF8|nr:MULTISPECIES: gephyrin-like molybdotransferase Glp [unclassified Saccharopolyspora]MBK0865688.1 molybdopterin molybdotransferase MoeA [Saccharopolyspora sp. HNM0986]MBQ6644947.1 molybdopterin molybdotransferase MoeA [Saccharopolyspora sp.]